MQNKFLKWLRIAITSALVLIALFDISPASPRPVHAAVYKFEDDEIIVHLDPTTGVTLAQINATYQTVTLEPLEGNPNTYRLRAPVGADLEALAATMAADSRLIFAEPNFIAEPPEANPRRSFVWGGNDAAPYASQYAINQLGLVQAQSVSTGAGITVAILDTGVQISHPALSGTWTTARYDFIDNDAVPEDTANAIDEDVDGLVDEAVGHGTHVAGIVHLVAPDARLMPLRVLDSDGLGDAFTIAQAIDFAIEHGAQVINLSLGTASESDLLDNAVKRATQHGIVVISAAGNLNSEEKQFPAAENCTLAVTSVGQTDVKSDFSNYGSWVDVAAPGEGIYSPLTGSGYGSWSGTSMSTPFVAGQAALIRSKSLALNPRQISNLIAETAVDTDPANPQFHGELGSGRIQIGASLVKLATGYVPENSGGQISSSCVEPLAPITPTATPVSSATPVPTLTPTPTFTVTPTPTVPLTLTLRLPLIVR